MHGALEIPKFYFLPYFNCNSACRTFPLYKPGRVGDEEVRVNFQTMIIRLSQFKYNWSLTCQLELSLAKIE